MDQNIEVILQQVGAISFGATVLSCAVISCFVDIPLVLRVTMAVYCVERFSRSMCGIVNQQQKVFQPFGSARYSRRSHAFLTLLQGWPQGAGS